MYKSNIIVIICLLVLFYISKRQKNKSNNDMNISSIVLFLLSFITIMFIYIGPTPIIFFNPIILILELYIIFYVLVRIFKAFRNLSYKLEAYTDIQTLNRDIDAKYNPSIASYLVHGTIEIKDIAADIMNLYEQKVINIEKQIIDNKIKYKLSLNENKINDIKLFESDIYIIDTVIQKKSEFEFDKWNKLVEDIFFNMGVCKKEKKQFTIRNIFVTALIVFFISIIPMQIYFKSFFLAIMASLIIACISTIPVTLFSDFTNSKALKKINLNHIGKEEVKKWIKFKNYIKDYTLLKDKNIEDIIIYEKYIPYAVSLKVNLNYEETIYSVFNEKEIEEIFKDIADEEIRENYL